MARASTGRFPPCALGACLLLAACGSAEPREQGPQAGDFEMRSLAKSDIGQVLEVHVSELRGHLEALMLKLYKRNPRELRKTPGATAEGNVTRLLARSDDWKFPELQERIGVDRSYTPGAPRSIIPGLAGGAGTLRREVPLDGAGPRTPSNPTWKRT